MGNQRLSDCEQQLADERQRSEEWQRKYENIVGEVFVKIFKKQKFCAFFKSESYQKIEPVKFR